MKQRLAPMQSANLRLLFGAGRDGTGGNWVEWLRSLTSNHLPFTIVRISSVIKIKNIFLYMTKAVSLRIKNNILGTSFIYKRSMIDSDIGKNVCQVTKPIYLLSGMILVLQLLITCHLKNWRKVFHVIRSPPPPFNLVL
jgi:hypothetical protein